MTKCPQRLSDGLPSVAAVHADILQTLLVLRGASFDPLSWRLAEEILQQHSLHNRLVLLQRAEQGPQGRVLMADDAGEGVVPPFADVVGPLRRVHCGPVLVPHHWRERRRRAVQLEQQATGMSVSHRTQNAADVDVVEVVNELGELLDVRRLLLSRNGQNPPTPYDRALLSTMLIVVHGVFIARRIFLFLICVFIVHFLRKLRLIITQADVSISFHVHLPLFCHFTYSYS